MFVKMVKEHSHDGNAARVEVSKLLNVIKERAKTTQELPSQIQTVAVQNLSYGSMGIFPSYNALKLIVQRSRRAIHSEPTMPKSRAEIVLPTRYTRIEISENVQEEFIIADSGVGDKRKNNYFW